MKINTILLAGIAVTAMTATPNSAFAKDWIDKVELTKDGVDIKEIEIASDGNSYTGIKTKDHRFALAIKVEAKSGKRIWDVTVESGDGADAFEAPDPQFWSYQPNKTTLGSGNNRTLNMQLSPTIDLDKVIWIGLISPTGLCQSNLEEKMQQGKSRASVLSQDWVVPARVSFSMNAVVTRPDLATTIPDISKPYSSESSSLVYPVSLRCLASKIATAPHSSVNTRKTGDRSKIPARTNAAPGNSAQSDREILPARPKIVRKPVKVVPRVTTPRVRTPD
ncbi:hypothetical protein [uncultured Parasphingorhabdus sp.]|uniref:hypothetical protein n=1 Tax=uncultured Parasphingorhabdus sp. TaxID=2709694 RepID=UPI0030D8B30A|tara:strand:- start:22770 stop:23603 length:834 start_codon:yes stop_codon:yes gene_type:complete